MYYCPGAKRGGVLVSHGLIEGDWLARASNMNMSTARDGRHAAYQSHTDTHTQGAHAHAHAHSPSSGRVEHVLVALLDPEDEEAAHHDGQHHHT